MPGTVITISPLIPVAKLEKIACGRVQRDGVAVFAAVTADGRQRSHLKRLGARLADDPALEVYGLTGRPDGTTWLTVFAAGKRDAGWFGGPHGLPAEADDYWSEPDTG
jgi:hypothetical protein